MGCVAFILHSNALLFHLFFPTLPHEWPCVTAAPVSLLHTLKPPSIFPAGAHVFLCLFCTYNFSPISSSLFFLTYIHLA